MEKITYSFFTSAMIVIMTKMQTKIKKKIFPPQFFFSSCNIIVLQLKFAKCRKPNVPSEQLSHKSVKYLHSLKIQSSAFLSSPYIQCKYISQIKVTKLDGTAYPQNSQENTFTPNSLECHV